MTKSKIRIVITLEMQEELTEKLMGYISNTVAYNGVRNGWYNKFKITISKELGGTETVLSARSGQ